MNRTCYLLLSVIAVFYCGRVQSLQWDANSLLQPGPCPTTSGHPHLSINIQLLGGQWNVAQLPREFSKCCRRPTVELLTDSPVPNQSPDQNRFTYLPSNWIKLKVDLLPCIQNQTSFHSLNTRLWQNSLSKESFLIELPWPFNLAGFSTINIIETDYKSFVSGYICHSLLLEHLSVPFVVMRPLSSLDQAHVLRLKWSLIKIGVPSAWSLTDIVSEECNELYASSSGTSGPPEGAKRPNDTLVTDIVHPVVNGSGASDFANNGTVIDWKVTNQHGNASSTTTHDPDSDVEWITAEYETVDGDDAIHFPGDEDFSGNREREDSSEHQSKTPAHPTPLQR